MKLNAVLACAVVALVSLNADIANAGRFARIRAPRINTPHVSRLADSIQEAWQQLQLDQDQAPLKSQKDDSSQIRGVDVEGLLTDACNLYQDIEQANLPQQDDEANEEREQYRETLHRQERSSAQPAANSQRLQTFTVICLFLWPIAIISGFAYAAFSRR